MLFLGIPKIVKVGCQVALFLVLVAVNIVVVFVNFIITLDKT